MTTVLPTLNQHHGFHGTTYDWTRQQLDAQGITIDRQVEAIGATLMARWLEASHGLQLQGFSPECTRYLLDSAWGRHLADRMADVSTAQLRMAVANDVRTQRGPGARLFDQQVADFRRFEEA